MKRHIIVIAILFILSLSNHAVANNKSITVEPILSVGSVSIETGNPLHLDVDYHLDGSQLFVECQLTGFSFKREAVGTLHQENEGHLRVYVDDEHIATVFEPAFYMRDLPKGDHEIKIQVIQNDHTPYEGLEEVLSITVE